MFEQSPCQPLQQYDESWTGGSHLEQLRKKLKIDTLYVKDGYALNIGITFQTVLTISAPIAGGGKDNGSIDQENHHVHHQIAQMCQSSHLHPQMRDPCVPKYRASCRQQCKTLIDFCHKKCDTIWRHNQSLITQYVLAVTIIIFGLHFR
jgi:hypothetical protein